MVEERGKAGARALSDWLRRCRATVGEVRGATFVRLMESLVESVLLYGAEVWGCGAQLGPVENVQMRAARIFLGGGSLHPLVSLQFEMNMLPMKWVAMKRSIEFWVQVMRMTDGRLLKVVMLEALEVGCKVRWVKELQQSLVRFKWKGLDAEAVSGLTLKEVKQVLKDIAWREVREVWREAARERPKLEVIGSLMDAECKARCVEIECKMQRRMMVKLRGGTAELRVETGRWCGLSRGERLCKNCDSGEVEDVKHFVCRCVFVAEERREMARLMNEIVVGWESMKDDDRVIWVLEEACKDGRVRKALQRMWQKRTSCP